MAVYIDPLVNCLRSEAWPYDKSCHLFADSITELHTFAEGIGLKREWFQPPIQGRTPHYDLTKGMRSRAVACGAVRISRGKAVKFWQKYWRTHHHG